MRKIPLHAWILAICISPFAGQSLAQVIGPSFPKLTVETSTEGQTALNAYSGPEGQIVPPPTNPNSIGIRGSGYSGIVGVALANSGFGVKGQTSRQGGNGIVGESTGQSGFGVRGVASASGGWAIFGQAIDDAEWAGYFSGGKGVLIRPRLGIDNFDPQYPIHVGTNSNNGNGAHVNAGGSWVNGSSRTFKQNFQPIDQAEILAKLQQLPISRWQYKGSDEAYHMGPMAEDFYQSFSLGHDQRYIATTDANGVALACIQALYDRIQALEKLVQELRNERK